MVQQRVVGRGKSKQGVKPGAEDQRELARYKVEAVSRAVLLLEAFRQSPGLQTVETLSKRTGLAVPAVKALLVTLAPGAGCMFTVVADDVSLHPCASVTTTV